MYNFNLSSVSVAHLTTYWPGRLGVVGISQLSGIDKSFIVMQVCTL